MLALINNLKTKYNLQIQCLHCDNAGENQAFDQTCDQEGLGIDFEYTAPGTPQQNGRVKHKFASLFNRVHAMLNGGKFTAHLQNGLWAEAANTADYSHQDPKPISTIFWEGKEKCPDSHTHIW